MKVFIIVLSALVAASYALPAYKPDQDIVDDLMKYSICVDSTKVTKDIENAEKNDPDVQKVLLYLTTDDFKDHVRALDQEPTYLAILTDMEKYGLPMYEVINSILTYYQIEPINQLTELQNGQNVGSLDTLFDKLMTDIDEKCTKNILEERQQADPKFKILIDHLKSDEFKQLVDAFKASESVKQSLDALSAKGLNLAKYVEYLKKLYHIDWW